jgi:opacity protein-like surface antigen
MKYKAFFEDFALNKELGRAVKKLTSLVGAPLVGASFLFSAGSLAADLPLKAPPKAAWVDSWAGPYIGAYFGAGAGRARENFTSTGSNLGISDEISTQARSSAGNLSGDVTGSMVDLFAGYNWRLGNFVVGGQVEGTVFSDVTLKAIGTHTFNSVSTNGVVNSTFSGFGTTENTQQLRSMAGAIGRVGYLVTPNVLLYGLGGLELGHFTYPDSDDRFGGKNGKWVAGYTVGAGGEVKLTDNWSLRGEYRYLHFDVNRNEATSSSQTFVQGGITSTSTSSDATARQANTDFHLGKVGLVYRFGEARPLSAMAAIPPAPGTAWGDGWAGPYFGAYFGAGAGRARESSRRTDTGTSNDGAQTSAGNTLSAGNLAGDMTGSMVDLFAGYNWRAGNFVVGGQVEGTLFSDVALTTIGTETFTSVSTTNGVVTGTSSGTNNNVENDQQLRSRVGLIGRVGYLVTPNVLLYGLGGLELGHFTYPDGDDRFGGKNGKWVAGYTAGAGGEVKLTDNWSLRGEYRYLHFGVNRNEASSSSQTSVQGGAASTNTDSEVTARQTNADFHLGKVGLVYRFGEARPLSAMAAIPPAPGTAWSDGWAGPYFGAYFAAGAGRARGSSTRTETNAFNDGTDFLASNTLSAGNLTGDMTGSMVDLFAGYNWRAGNFVVGGQVEGTVFSDVALKTIGTETFTAASTTNGVVTSTASGFNTIENTEQLRSRAGLIGRVGYLVTPNVLLYGLGGLELGHFITFPGGEQQRVGTKNGKWVAGYTAGAGGEVKLTDNWSLRGEYRYLHFDVNRNEAYSNSQTSAQGGITSVNTDSEAVARRTNADFHVGKVGLVYRFGEARPLSAMAAMPVKAAPRSACCDSWAGTYAGAYFGSGAGRARETLTDTTSAFQSFTFNNVTQTATISSAGTGNLAGHTTGSMVDLFAGYNWRAGNFLVGGQLEGTLFSDVALKTIGPEASTADFFGVPVSGTNTNENNQRLRSMVGAIGRVGYLVTPRVLLYGLGGLELGHFTYPDSEDRFGGKNGKWVAGYTVGAGGELKVTDRWSLRGEYRYLHFNVNRNEASISSSISGDGANSFTIASNDATTRQIRADLHLGKIGLAYTFCYCD